MKITKTNQQCRLFQSVCMRAISYPKNSKKRSPFSGEILLSPFLPCSSAQSISFGIYLGSLRFMVSLVCVFLFSKLILPLRGSPMYLSSMVMKLMQKGVFFFSCQKDTHREQRGAVFFRVVDCIYSIQIFFVFMNQFAQFLFHVCFYLDHKTKTMIISLLFL